MTRQHLSTITIRILAWLIIPASLWVPIIILYAHVRGLAS